MTNIWRGSQSASSRYWYDLAGNLVTSIVKNVTNCYYYNVQNKLVKIVGTNFVNEFRYNSRNERIAVGIGPSTNSLVWRYDACQGPVTLAEFNSNSEMTRWYVRGLGVAEGIGDVIAEVEVLDSPAKPHYYLSNHRGDTLVVLNPDGAANSTFRYDAFGNCYAATGPFTPRYTFSTKEYLLDAKLYLYAYRVYDPIAGRWTQRDPIDYQDSPNLYQFCGNNALNFIDALGLFRFGTRPLNGSHGINWTSPTTTTALLGPVASIVVSALADPLNAETVHEHGFFEDGTGDNVGFFKDGRRHDENQANFSMDHQQYDDDTMRKALENVKDGEYSLLGGHGKTKNNCQDWCARLRNEYKKIKDAEKKAQKAAEKEKKEKNNK